MAANQFSKEKIDQLESFFKFSPLDIPNKIERNNLQRLLALVIAFPFLRKFINYLIARKRLTAIYSLFYNLYRPYCLVFKIMPHKLSPKELFWLTRRYLTK